MPNAPKPKGFNEFDNLMRKLVKVKPTELPTLEVSFICGPTCGCGQSFPATMGERAICPHCGKDHGVLPAIDPNDIPN